uniref:Uncharacterized protein n=1 Tax=Sinocyclocheilus anshuiensis TaxID=1608454 RepID=A0A671LCS7_9TELE
IMGIRCGICSAGKISHDFTVALKTLHQVKNTHLTRTESHFAQKHSIPRVYSSYEELARDSFCDKKLQLTFFPGERATKEEKPLAVNLKEVQELIATRLAHGGLLGLFAGVDEATVVTLKFCSVCTCTITAELPNEAVIVGTKGTIRVPAHMWCPTSLMGNGVETQYPVPEPSLPLNFIHSTGMCYEAEEVHRCLLHGTESIFFLAIFIKNSQGL